MNSTHRADSTQYGTKTSCQTLKGTVVQGDHHQCALPYTGSDVGTILTVGGLLFLLGVIVLIAAWPRKQ